MFTDGFEFDANVINVIARAGSARARIFKQPDRLHLARIDSSLSGYEVGTALLLAVVTFGLMNNLIVLDADFEPDSRPGRTRRHLMNWYAARSIFVTTDGHDLFGELTQIAASCQNVLAEKRIDYRINLL